MSKEELQRYFSYFLAGFSTISSVAGLSQLKSDWLMVVLVLSGILAVCSAVFLFSADKNIAFRELNNIFQPEFTVRKIAPDSKEELKAISKLDRNIYGDDSVDYNGLLEWWEQYKGVTILLKNSEIIGGVGIWPVKEETFNKLVKGDLDENRINKDSICKESDPTPRAFWYFGDIILLRKYRRKMRNLSLVLLNGAIREWKEDGNLADEIHICALAFKDKRERRTKTPGQGEELLKAFNFKRVAQSPTGFPVYARTLTKKALDEEYETQIKPRLLAIQERDKKRTVINAQVSRTWRWIPAATAMIILIAVLLINQLTHSSSTGPPIPINENVPENLAIQTAKILKIGLDDHTHCAVDWWDGKPFSKEKMTKEMGPKYIGLVNLVEENLAGAYEVAIAHRCELERQRRSFIHLILRKPNALLSLIITEKKGDNLPQNILAAASIASGVPLYRDNMKTFEVAGFETQNHLVFVVSNLDKEGNLQIASKLAPGVRNFLGRLEL